MKKRKAPREGKGAARPGTDSPEGLRLQAHGQTSSSRGHRCGRAQYPEEEDDGAQEASYDDVFFRLQKEGDLERSSFPMEQGAGGGGRSDAGRRAGEGAGGAGEHGERRGHRAVARGPSCVGGGGVGGNWGKAPAEEDGGTDVGRPFCLAKVPSAERQSDPFRRSKSCPPASVDRFPCFHMPCIPCAKKGCLSPVEFFLIAIYIPMLSRAPIAERTLSAGRNPAPRICR